MEDLTKVLSLILAISLVWTVRVWLTRGRVSAGDADHAELEQARAILEALLPGMGSDTEGQPDVELQSRPEADTELLESLVKYFHQAHASKAVLLSLLPHPDGIGFDELVTATNTNLAIARAGDLPEHVIRAVTLQLVGAELVRNPYSQFSITDRGRRLLDLVR